MGNTDTNPLQLDLEDLAFDPTMASCCIQDLEEQRKVDELREKLNSVDITKKYADRYVLAASPAPQSETAEDNDLARIRQKRRIELEAKVDHNTAKATKGHGLLNPISEAQFVEHLADLDGNCVCHFASGDFEPSSQLDQLLDTLAFQYRGTFFVRISAYRGSPLARRLHLQTIPALVCFRNGAVVGQTGLNTFGSSNCILGEEVVLYLQRLRVLKSSTSMEKSSFGAMKGKSDSESDEEGNLKDRPCEICGRRYPHEHIKAAFKDGDQDDEDSEFDA